MSAPQAGDFWQWSVAHYGREGVEPLLLQLQDEFGFDINIALWCCWCAKHYEAAPDFALRNAIEQTDGWNTHVTQSLRSVRRFLKAQQTPMTADDAAFRESIKSAELKAEEKEQSRLAALAEIALSRLGAAADQRIEEQRNRSRRNLATYTALIGAAKKDRFTVSALETLIDCIFAPQQPATAIRE